MKNKFIMLFSNGSKEQPVKIILYIIPLYYIYYLKLILKSETADSNFKDHSKQLYRLLQHVRLPLAKPQFLLDVVQVEPLVKQNR